MQVELSPADIGVIHTLGALRTAVSKASGATPRQFGHDQTAVDVTGVAAEYAWAKHHNVFPDLTFISRRNGFDNITAGKRVDIKSTSQLSGRLISNPQQQNPDIDLMVLAIVQLPFVHFVGWCRPEELRKPEHLIDLGHGPVYALGQGSPDLKPFKAAPKRKPANVAGSVTDSN